MKNQDDPAFAQTMELIEQYLDEHADEWLENKNINSVGIAYKVKEGEELDEISIQFTVDKKIGSGQNRSAASTLLQAMDMPIIPPFITIGDQKIPTDVVEMQYKFSQAVNPKPTGKMDPIRPGISVGHAAKTGTIGCLVRHSSSGDICVLSNWHVLHGSDGKIGDPVAQPGYWDNQNVVGNVFGTLVNSYFGKSGDCAIASILNRNADPIVLGLNVTLTALREPRIGDRVAKCGRTTEMTFGKVVAVGKRASMTFPGMNRNIKANIKCFLVKSEAENEPVSGDGDSGAAWVFVNPDGSMETTMAGLHFGARDHGPEDHALACYANAVFEVLGIEFV